MPRLKLLILDASEVIHLHEFGIWARFAGLCEVFLARTVAEDAVTFFEDGERANGGREPTGDGANC